MTRSPPFLYLHPATNHPSPEPRRVGRVGLVVLIVAVSATAAGVSWQVRTSPTTKGSPWAVISSAAGDELALFRDKNNQVHLQFKLAGTFATLAAGRCPTFQVDTQTALYHLAVDKECHVDHKRVLFDVGTVRNRMLVSAPVEQLMNGTQLEIRYVTADGTYHKADFPLHDSSLAIRRALGRSVRVRAH